MAKRREFRYVECAVSELMRTHIITAAKDPVMLVDELSEFAESGDKMTVHYDTKKEVFVGRVYGSDVGKNKLRAIKSEAKQLEVLLALMVVKWRELGGCHDWLDNIDNDDLYML